MVEVVGLVEAARKVADVDPYLETDELLCEIAVALEQTRAAIDAASINILAELHVRNTTDTEHGLPTPTWLARHTHSSVGAAKHRVRTAIKVRTKFRLVHHALANGDITYDHVRVLSKACRPPIADAIVELEAELLDLANGMVFEAWRAQVESIVELLDQDGTFDPNDDLDRNSLSLSATIDGITKLDGTLTGDNAIILTELVNTKADELFRQFTTDATHDPDLKVPARRTLLALALVELVRAGAAIDLTTTRPPGTEAHLIIPAGQPTTPHPNEHASGGPPTGGPAGGGPHNEGPAEPDTSPDATETGQHDHRTPDNETADNETADNETADGGATDHGATDHGATDPAHTTAGNSGAPATEATGTPSADNEAKDQSADTDTTPTHPPGKAHSAPPRPTQTPPPDGPHKPIGPDVHAGLFGPDESSEAPATPENTVPDPPEPWRKPPLRLPEHHEPPERNEPARRSEPPGTTTPFKLLGTGDQPHPERAPTPLILPHEPDRLDPPNRLERTNTPSGHPPAQKHDEPHADPLSQPPGCTCGAPPGNDTEPPDWLNLYDLPPTSILARLLALKPRVATRHGTTVQDGTYRLLACDARWQAFVIDNLGVPLDMGRSTRFATEPQRKAIALRDGGCIFPGCTMPVTWCDIHHVEHWQDLGPTDLVLLAALCRRHHRVAHRKNWTMQPTHNGWFTWTTPSGRTLTSQRHHRQRNPG